MGQPRLNHVMVTAVHRGKIEQLNVDKIMTEFVLRNDERRKNICCSALMMRSIAMSTFNCSILLTNP